MWYLKFSERNKVHAYPLGETVEEAFKFSEGSLRILASTHLYVVSKTVSEGDTVIDPKFIFGLPKCIDAKDSIAFNYFTGEYIDLGEYELASDYNPVLLLVADPPLVVPDKHLVGKWRGNTISIFKKGSDEYRDVFSNKNIRKLDIGIPFARF